jgi:ABC-2 type transport system ATP-binding protein
VTVVEVADLGKRYGKQVAVDGISFTVEEGEIFGILGPNGAGKTTTVECVAGLRTPDTGRITVLGLEPQRDAVKLRHLVGVQLQESELPERLTVGEALRLYASFYDKPADWQALLDDLGLTGKQNTRYRKLSGGQRQRLSIALALVGNPRVAILDELTTGLDPQARRDTWDLIEQVRARGVTILLVTHFMEEAERLCDRVALIDAGRIVAIDSPAGLVSRVDDEQRMRFRPNAELDDSLLTALPEVKNVTRQGRQVIVTGTGNLVLAVISVLARHQIVALELRVEQASLDDAFVALTGRRLDRDTPANDPADNHPPDNRTHNERVPDKRTPANDPPGKRTHNELTPDELSEVER